MDAISWIYLAVSKLSCHLLLYCLLLRLFCIVNVYFVVDPSSLFVCLFLFFFWGGGANLWFILLLLFTYCFHFSGTKVMYPLWNGPLLWCGGLFLLLTTHNWQKWQSTFLTCACYEIYREEGIGLKNSNYT